MSDTEMTKQDPNDNDLRQSDALAFILHQDKLMWGRVQTIALVQLAGLGAAYAVRDVRWLSVSALVLCAVLTFLIHGLLRVDEAQRRKIHAKYVRGLNWRTPRRFLLRFVAGKLRGSCSW